MVDGLWMLLGRVCPGFDHFKNEEIVLVDEMSIDHLAFKVGEALGHQRRRDTLGWCWRQTKSLELVHISPRAVTDTHDLGRKFRRWNGDYSLFRRPQSTKAVIGVADDTGNHRRLKLDHHVPGHRHHIGMTLVSGRQQDYRTRFEQLVDFRQR